MRKKFIIGLLSTILAFNLVSCGSAKPDAKESGSKVDVEQLKQKYGDKKPDNYTDPLYNLERNHVFEFDMEKAVYDKHSKKISDAFAIYIDADLKMSIKPKISYDEKTKKLKVEAPNVPVFYNDDDFDKSRTDINVKDFDVETSRENERDWGNANNYYMAKHIDFKTGEKLKQPELTIFTIKPELNTPTTKFYLNESGKAGLKWNAIEGASKYIIYSVSIDKDGTSHALREVAETKKTNFEDFLGAVVDFEGMVITTNNDFDTKSTSTDRKYCVMAVSEDKKSLMSNVLDTKDFASQTPIKADIDKNKTIDKGAAFSDFPTHLYVKMGDGQSILTPIDFDREFVEFTKHDKHGLIAQIRYKYRGTSIVSKYSIKVDKEDDKTKKDILEVLKTLQDRQDKIKWNGLNSSIEDTIESTPPSDLPSTPDAEKPDTEKPKKDVVVNDAPAKIHASSALSEYIALNMLDGKEKVNLDEFPEASNKDILVDAFYEALYQNPLVMSVKKFGYDYKTNELLVEYGQTTEEQKKMQTEVKAEVDKAVKEIIKDGMTPIEKEFAINKYLCDTAKYDDAALESAEKNNMLPDEKFNTSFTSYGVLVNKVGVCASYAASFKLIADASGLESIVVTGNLNGSLPHAWNRILIDGQWMTLDSTNNDNDTIPNALINLPDSLSKSVLVEDDLFSMNDKIKDFKGTNENLEYYKVNKQYFSQKDAVKGLATELKNSKENTVVIRTDVDISEKAAAEIVLKACKEAGVKPKNASCWLGVISVEK